MGSIGGFLLNNRSVCSSFPYSEGSLEHRFMVTLACSGSVITNTELGSNQTQIVCHL